MRQHPVFVPFQGEHLAAVVTVPDRDPRSLVFFLQGAGGTPRYHRHRAWARMAHALADRGVASVRMDYLGLGDSSGTTTFQSHVPSPEQVASVARMALRATGAERLGLVSTCRGGRVLFHMAADLGAESVACIMPMSIQSLLREPAASSIPARRTRTRAPSQARRVIARGRDEVTLRLGFGFIPEVGTVLRSASVLFVLGDGRRAETQLQRGMRALARRLGDGASDRYRIVALSHFARSQTQAELRDVVVDWLDSTLTDGSETLTERTVEEGSAPTLGSAGAGATA